MLDPYTVLGVARTATMDAIKAAYRKLAMDYHPDRNPGDASAERRFKDVNQAYELLKDADKRAAYDRGEIDADGRRRGFGRTYARGFGTDMGMEAGPGRSGFETIFERAFSRSGGFHGGGASFEDLLRGRKEQRSDAGAKHRVRGADRRHALEIDFRTSARGGRERVTFEDGRTVEIDIPAGTGEGQVLRLKGQGRPGILGGAAGDALIEISVRPHPDFSRVGDDIHHDLPISLPEAVLGAKVDVPTVDGKVRLSIPAGANSGQTLRLRGKGLPRSGGGLGDQLVRLSVVLPDPPDPELERFLKRWATTRTYDVRQPCEPV